MTPSDKRRPSFLQRVRPFTAGGERAFAPLPARPHAGLLEGTADAGHHELGPVESGAFLPLPSAIDPRDFDTPPEPTRKRHHSKSFSGLRHGVGGGLRSVVRRLSVSVRQHKTYKQPSSAAPTGDMEQAVFGKENQPPEGRKPAGSRSRPIPRHSSLGSLDILGSSPTQHVVLEPIPGNRGEPPVLPHDLSRGAAARAAAAAQNEQIKLERMASNTESPFLDKNLNTERSFDSESGIEINIQDASDMEDELEIVRRGKMTLIANDILQMLMTTSLLDPAVTLPAELMAHVLSYLDADSLRNGELVSRVWHAQASSRHVWRDVFRREYRGRPNPSDGNDNAKSMGLGKTVPNRDWKKMFSVRRALEQRWKEGKAAAIYLHGHKDSVYCVQFDE